MPAADLAPQPAAADADATGAFLARAIGWILTFAGAAGLLAAFTLTVEKIRLLEDPTHVPACSINAVLSCGSVMSSPQAEAFGVPNPLLGIAGFSALAALGVALVAGARLPRWLWLAIQAGVTFALGFVHWLFFQSVYRIEALCPYCMVVWVAAIVAFVYVTLRNLAEGALPTPRALRVPAAAAVRNHGVIVTVWLLAVGLLIGVAFWDYWRTLL
ncbi:vitamin K epoxide reductase family protein [Conexibacter woesei]|uniref:Vitamin K epoxide reductase n=1 Tax=Conexibacter woesei (strain DSM 14684 / CCUG 47730 / CIP 108061 / JCM 11494 / NBRC 100937 / ID131577) TaxID=469383 RepID=D3F7P5_CONWI|nr:vitamin K epoxide reductase family protein [Conexibacter woesei]ADB50907.1 Vitamin K epoxide reductase [Conexibacter woesei DSM 14684]